MPQSNARDHAFNEFRDRSFIKFLEKLIRGVQAPSYMSGVASDFTGNSNEILEINRALLYRGGLVQFVKEVSGFVTPPESVRFLIDTPSLEDAVELLDAVREEERPATAKELLDALEVPLPASMRVLLLDTSDGETRVSTPGGAPDSKHREIRNKKKESSLNFDAMERFLNGQNSS